MDKILESIFCDSSLWAEVIGHGMKKRSPAEVLEYIQDPHGRAELCRLIGTGSYTIEPPHTGYRPKDDGGERVFFANAPLDRLLLNVIYKWLMRNAPEMVHPCCLSYQEGTGVGDIVCGLSRRIATLGNSGSGNIVGRKFDIHKYFDTVGRKYIHRAFDRIEERHGKSSVIALLRKYYDSDIYYDTRLRKYVSAYQGIKQGCAVSSWLANVILYELDSEVSALDGFYVRYSDDIIFVGEEYEKATEAIEYNLHKLGLTLNERKIENVVGNEFIRFLGYNIRGSEISLSKKWVGYFRESIDKITVGNRRLIATVRAAHKEKDGEQREKKLRKALDNAAREVARFLYLGNGEYSWAQLVLRVINRPEDIETLNLYCLDALRAVYTGKTSIGGLGVCKRRGITRGKGKNVAQNRRKTAHIFGNEEPEGWIPGYFSIVAMRNNIGNRWLYRAMVSEIVCSRKRAKYGCCPNAAAGDEERKQLRLQLEEHYCTYMNSRPNGKKDGRYYAKGFPQMKTIDLLRGNRRSEARAELENFIGTSICYKQLQKNGRHWYWQSKAFPQLVLLREWFEE